MTSPNNTRYTPPQLRPIAHPPIYLTLLNPNLSSTPSTSLLASPNTSVPPPSPANFLLTSKHLNSILARLISGSSSSPSSAANAPKLPLRVPDGPAGAFLEAAGEAGVPADDFLADSGNLSAVGVVEPDTKRRDAAAFARAMAGASGMERVREAQPSVMGGVGARQDIMWMAAVGSWGC
ncbi:hypothetical protein VC83_08014 [Pseudogymnoascus destructans]|uniref:Uncharacterized protein n=1 Tax=Pseudogymnoascus destructans TaxID=655981 RepID=A0A177A4H9_9PEZI|nr:uncharacterized protein VC83_08014 [Pseudogymnoascus destructans]OAF55854.1 hypothetical protein VC83_08014 [Pseudogymnoascus destructans]